MGPFPYTRSSGVLVDELDQLELTTLCVFALILLNSDLLIICNSASPYTNVLLLRVMSRFGAVRDGSREGRGSSLARDRLERSDASWRARSTSKRDGCDERWKGRCEFSRAGVVEGRRVSECGGKGSKCRLRIGQGRSELDALRRVGGERESQGTREEEHSSETSAVVVLDLYLTLTRRALTKPLAISSRMSVTSSLLSCSSV